MIPLVVKPNLTQGETDNFRLRFGNERAVRETVWRRHQCEENKNESGWRPGDFRRRLLHFRDRYAIINNNFCLVQTYVYLSLALPEDELEGYRTRIRPIKGLKMEVDYNKCRLDLRLFSHGYDADIAERPWKLFDLGIRSKLNPGHPTYINDLEPFFPAHVELGCGPSVEAGIPPLHYFHKLFGIQCEGRFVFSPEQDSFLALFDDPLAWYERSVHMQRCTLVAEPTPFYHRLKRLHEQGKVLGPIYNNNFDGLPLSVGLPELCLRQYDKGGVYPHYQFDPNARSLIVVGGHADRRECQASARRAGLQIVFVDPEGYDTPGGFLPYPLEAPQDQDYVFKVKAADCFKDQQ